MEAHHDGVLGVAAAIPIAELLDLPAVVVVDLLGRGEDLAGGWKTEAMRLVSECP